MNIKELAEQAETYAAENSGAFRGELYMRCFTEKLVELVAAAEREKCAKAYEPHIHPSIVSVIRPKGDKHD